MGKVQRGRIRPTEEQATGRSQRPGEGWINGKGDVRKEAKLHTSVHRAEGKGNAIKKCGKQKIIS